VVHEEEEEEDADDEDKDHTDRVALGDACTHCGVVRTCAQEDKHHHQHLLEACALDLRLVVALKISLVVGVVASLGVEIWILLVWRAMTVVPRGASWVHHAFGKAWDDTEAMGQGRDCSWYCCCSCQTFLPWNACSIRVCFLTWNFLLCSWVRRPKESFFVVVVAFEYPIRRAVSPYLMHDDDDL